MDRQDRKDFEWIMDIPSTEQSNDVHVGLKYLFKGEWGSAVSFTVLSIEGSVAIVETEHGEQFPFNIKGFEKNLKDKTVIKYEDYLKAIHEPTSEEAAKLKNYI